MKCLTCGEEFIHGDTFFYNDYHEKYICKKCMVEWLVEKVQDDLKEAADRFGWYAEKYDARNEK